MKHPGIDIAGTHIGRGGRALLELPIAGLYSHAPMNLPVQVVCGERAGPRLFVSAAVHGDEINGVEIIRRLLRLPLLARLRGTLIAVPIVNVHGFLNRSRYLPDRRDLNRSFPGSERGSMAARLAHLFLNTIVANSDYGIDLHTAAVHRENLPQVRANLDDPETARIAHAFHVPVLLNANLRDGSLREAAAEHGVPMLLYEGGEALRFDEHCIRAGLKGVVSVMRELGMLSRSRAARSAQPLVARSSTWVRVRRGDPIGVIADPFGAQELEVASTVNGIVIGRHNLPLVNEGEALFHIARFESTREAENAVEAFRADDLPVHPAVDEEPPIV
jgi:predicted deacylase